MGSMKVYFDNAATTPMRNEVIEMMTQSMTTTFGNPSSTHGFGRSAKSIIETAVKALQIPKLRTTRDNFTSGGTESDNMVLRCAVKDLKVKTIVSSVLFIMRFAPLGRITERRCEYSLCRFG